MTPLQNDPQQHQREANNREFRIPRGGKRSPDSASARRELSKSGFASHVGLLKCDFTSSRCAGSVSSRAGRENFDVSPRAGDVGGHFATVSCMFGSMARFAPEASHMLTFRAWLQATACMACDSIADTCRTWRTTTAHRCSRMFPNAHIAETVMNSHASDQ